MSDLKQSDNLYHYGVKGMRWGIRRAQRRLSNSTSKEGRDKAVSSLNKHKEKAQRKVAKLQKKENRLQKDVDRHVAKTDVKSAKLHREASRTRRKAYGMFTSQRYTDRKLYIADKLDAKAEELKAISESAKARLAKNQRAQELFRKGISDIDTILVEAGKKKL